MMPRSIDEFCSVEFRTKPDETARTLTRLLSEEYDLPRDNGLVRRFIAETLPAGRILVYGAGTLGRELLPVIEARPGVQIVGFLDRNAERMTDFEGYDVFAPDTAASIDCDYVLLAHQSQERHMSEALLAAGVPRHAIRLIFGAPDFAGFTEAWVNEKIAALPTRASAVVIGTLPEYNSIIHDEFLEELLPSQDTWVMYFGRREIRTDDELTKSFRLFDCHQSLTMMRHALERLQPKFIYLKATLHSLSPWLAFVVQQYCPTAKIVTEFNDWTVLLSAPRLRSSFGYDDRDLAQCRFGEWYASMRHDAVVTKQGGVPWEHLVGQMKAAHLPFFPAVNPHSPVPEMIPPPPPAPIRVLFAGMLRFPQVDGTKIDHPDLNQGEILRDLFTSRDFLIDIYNVLHLAPAMDELYRVYMDWFDTPGSPIQYHRRISLDEVAQIIPNYHIGWCVTHGPRSEETEALTKLVVPSKVATYFSQGLPVIIDDQYYYMAELIDCFKAGIVVPLGDFASIPDRLRAADFAQLRAGAFELLRYMKDSNRNTLARFREIVAEALKQA